MGAYMANPQKENGFTSIANEIIEALYKINLRPYETRVLLCIIRKTYGFNKKGDKIPVSQIEASTGIYKGHVSRALKELQARNIVTRSSNKYTQINKNYDQWLHKQVTISSDKVTQTSNYLLNKSDEIPENNQNSHDQKLPKHATNEAKVTRLGQKVAQTCIKKLPKQVDSKDNKETIKRQGAAVDENFNEEYFLNDDNQIKQELVDAWQKNIGNIIPTSGESLCQWQKDAPISWIVELIEKCHKDNIGKPIPYIQKVLYDWIENGKKSNKWDNKPEPEQPKRYFQFI